MPISRNDLADFSCFIAIAKHRSFRRAGLELGVSASALSHSLKGLENRLGVRLLNRTNRGVTLTAAGEELQAAILAPVLPTFVDRYPAIEVDVVVSNRLVDVVAAGADAGIRYAGTVPEDMIA